MTLKAVIASLEDVDESLREMYVQSGDSYVLDVEGMVAEDAIETHEKTQGLKSALDKERQAKRDFEKRLKEMERSQNEFTADDLKELEELREVKKKAEEERRRQSGEFDKWREEINTEHQSALDAQTNVIKNLQEQIRADRIGRQIAEACAEHGAPNSLMSAYIEKHIKSSFNDEGILEVSVMDPTDNTRMIDGEGNPLSINGFVKKLSESKEFGQYFTSKQKAGAGTPSGDGEGDGTPGEKPNSGDPVDLDKMSAPQRALHEKKQKIAEFRQAQERHKQNQDTHIA